MAYDGVALNEERATELFAERGRTSDAVLQQATSVIATGELQHRLEGPADTGSAGVAHERCVAIDGTEVTECDEDCDALADHHAALPDDDYPQAALPAMHFCADGLTNGGKTEMQAVKKIYCKSEQSREASVCDQYSRPAAYC